MSERVTCRPVLMLRWKAFLQALRRPAARVHGPASGVLRPIWQNGSTDVHRRLDRSEVILEMILTPSWLLSIPDQVGASLCAVDFAGVDPGEWRTGHASPRGKKLIM